MFLQINKPDKGDPFFNTAACGGVSTCIVIKNCAEGLNTLPNCVAGAVGAYEKAACEDISKPTFNHLPYPPNAENIYAYAHNKGLPVSDTPAVGAIVVWQKGATLNGSDGAGHVAFIYKVDESGNIYTSESEYGGRAWVNRSYTRQEAISTETDINCLDLSYSRKRNRLNRNRLSRNRLKQNSLNRKTIHRISRSSAA